MLILAIDTALEACAAAVLDTDAGELLAHAVGTFPIPVTIISGALSDESVDSLS